MTMPKYITVCDINGSHLVSHQSNDEATLDEDLKRNHPITGEVKYIRADISQQTNPQSPGDYPCGCRYGVFVSLYNGEGYTASDFGPFDTEKQAIDFVSKFDSAEFGRRGFCFVYERS